MFLITGGDGNIYEGIGWNKEGFHTLNWNTRSMAIAFIGSFDTTRVSEAMLDALEDIINCGISKGYINNQFNIHGHRDMRDSGTACPGEALYNQLKAFYAFQSGPI